MTEFKSMNGKSELARISDITDANEFHYQNPASKHLDDIDYLLRAFEPKTAEKL